jgi:hypothetical protein
MKKLKKQIFVISFLFFVFTLRSFGQENIFDSKIDEFGILNLEDLMARTDNLAVQLQNDPNLITGIFVAAEPNIRDFAFSAKYAAMIKAYLVNNRKITPDRIFTVNLGIDSSARNIQLHTFGKDYKIYSTNRNVSTPEKTVLFDTRYFDNPYFKTEYADLCCEIIGATEYMEKASIDFLADLMSRSPQSKISLIGYAGSNVFDTSFINSKGKLVKRSKRKLDSPQTVEKILRETKKLIVAKGIDESRISFIKGGYTDSTRKVEIYFIPQNGVIPEPKPNFFPKVNKLSRK